MMNVSAAQLIYSNVDAGRSPQRRDGFQTLFHTVGSLTDDELLDIPRHLNYKREGPQDGGELPRKHVFAHLGLGKVILAQVVPVLDTDEYGRTGLSIGHALILDRAAFDRAENNPFAVFRGFENQFHTRIEDAIAHAQATGGFADGYVPPASITPEATPTGRQEGAWDAGQLPHLLLVAARADRHEKTGRFAGFLGPCRKMYRLLESLFDILPHQLRAYCTFDTLLPYTPSRCPPYWAVGLPSSRGCSSDLIPFDLEKGRFESGMVGRAEDPFEELLLEATCDATVAFRHRIATAHEMRDWFEGKAARLPDDIDESLFARFDSAYPQILERRIQTALEERIGSPRLAKRLTPLAVDWTMRHAAVLREVERKGFGRAELRDWTRTAYGQYLPPHDQSELGDLLRFAKSYNDPWLVACCLRWMKDWPRLASELRAMADDVYFDFARWAIRDLAADVRWGIRPSGTVVSFGPYIRLPSEGAADSHGLLMALLGVSLQDVPADPEGLGLFGWLGSKKSHNAPSYFPTSVDVSRWLSLMQQIEELRAKWNAIAQTDRR